MTDLAAMRAAAATVLTPGVYPGQEELEELRLRLRGHLRALIPAVEELARTRPAESLPRDDALAEAQSARTLLDISPEPGVRGAVRHVAGLARELRALCDQHDVLTGTRPLGVR